MRERAGIAGGARIRDDLVAALAKQCGPGFELLFRQNPLPMWLYDPLNAKILEVNAAAERVYGYSRDEFLRLTLKDIRPPEDIARLEAELGTARDAGKSNGFHLSPGWRHLRRDGSTLWVHVHSQEFEVVGRRLRLAIIVDFTDQRQLAESLESKTVFLNATLDALGDGVAACNQDGRLTMFNRAACEMIGAADSSLIPEQWAAHYNVRLADGKTPAPTAQLPLQRALNGETVNDVVLVIAPEDKPPRTILVNGRPLVLDSGRQLGAVAIFRDITELRRSERAVARLSRISTVLSSINNLIVRARNRDELFMEACRLAVQDGKFRLAWIGAMEGDHVRPAAVFGAGSDQVSRLMISLKGDGPSGRGGTATALRERRPYVCNDILTDPTAAPWLDDMRTAGIGSFACFPLLVGGQIAGSISFYAPEPGFFLEEEMKLLAEIAGDIAYSLEFIAREEKLNYIAFYDPTTRLANRSMFLERLTQFLETARQTHSMLAVPLLDLENFKAVNDSLGRSGGDEVLRIVGQRLALLAGGANHIARVGGDQFAMAIAGLKRPADLTRLLEQDIWELLAGPVSVGGKDFRLSLKVGVAMFPDDGEDAESLLRNAESALKKAKASQQRHLFYTREMSAALDERHMLERLLHRALERKEFVLHYQPKVNVRSGLIVGVEALIRWDSPDLGLVPPLRFIPLLEDTGLIVEVGRCTLKEAAREYRSWCDDGLNAPPIAVNVSPLQLRQPDFVDFVRGVVSGMEGEYNRIDLEVTESMLMADVDATIGKLDALRAIGVNVSIDDFGTGFSSLSYLAKLPVSAVKIDRSFVAAMTENANSMSIVSTIISLAHSMSLKVIAEGVESPEQLKLLRLLNCDEMQGYLFSKPLPAEAMVALLRQSQQQRGAGERASA